MSDDVVDNLKESSTWVRILLMAGFAVALYVTGVVLLVITLAQILFSLITGDSNANLRRVGASLSDYVAQILAFLTYNSESRPFPFLWSIVPRSMIPSQAMRTCLRPSSPAVSRQQKPAQPRPQHIQKKPVLQKIPQLRQQTGKPTTQHRRIVMSLR